MAMMMVATPGPMTEESTIARTRPGTTRKKSMTRISTAWVAPVKCPAAMPTTVPMTMDTAVAANPTSSETRAPQTSIASTERPGGSVPSGFRPGGAWFWAG